MAAATDHIDHVRTQLPYALLVGIVGLSVGTIPGGFGMPPWISIVIGIAILGVFLRIVGKRAEAS